MWTKKNRPFAFSITWVRHLVRDELNFSRTSFFLDKLWSRFGRCRYNGVNVLKLHGGPYHVRAHHVILFPVGWREMGSKNKKIWTNGIWRRALSLTMPGTDDDTAWLVSRAHFNEHMDTLDLRKMRMEQHRRSKSQWDYHAAKKRSQALSDVRPNCGRTPWSATSWPKKKINAVCNTKKLTAIYKPASINI